MEQPVLVREYSKGNAASKPTKTASAPALPPIAAYAFADLVRSADGPDFQSAIDGIAEICARNRLSLAEEHGSHRPPVGEITETSSRDVGPQLRKPGIHRALTSVPEASSGSSEGSRKGMFSLRRKGKEQVPMAPKVMHIGVARTLKIESTTAVSKGTSEVSDGISILQTREQSHGATSSSSSTAIVSLRSLLAAMIRAPD